MIGKETPAPNPSKNKKPAGEKLPAGHTNS